MWLLEAFLVAWTFRKKVFPFLFAFEGDLLHNLVVEASDPPLSLSENRLHAITVLQEGQGVEGGLAFFNRGEDRV